MINPLFELGLCVITANAQQALEQRGQMPIAQTILNRHALGDWGDVCPEDWQANERALRDGDRLFSVYLFEDGYRLWVITEADRSATTILEPDDY
jgi:hypothetical protein